MTTPALRSTARERVTDATSLVLASVHRAHATLRTVAWARAASIGVGAACSVWLVTRFAERLWAMPSWMGIVAALGAGGAISAVLTRRVRAIDALRTALWMEEQTPAGFALVTLVERENEVARARAQVEPFNTLMRERLADAYIDAAGGSSRADELVRTSLRALAVERLRDPLLFVLISVALLAWWSLAPRPGGAIEHSASRTPAGDIAPDTARSNVPIGAWRVRVLPPAYSGLPAQALGDVESVRALSGSTLSIDGTGTSPSAVQVRALVDSVTAARTGGWAISARALRVTRSGNGWTATLTTDALPTELRVTRGTATRLLLLEGYGDSIPRISLRLPVRDSVLRRATGRLPLESTLHDDLGLASGTFELIVSSGEGERFTARTLRVGARAYARDRDVTLRAALNLDSMQLAPGDIVHLRAVARDAHPGAAREAGSSETRSLRVARPAEYDSVSVEPAPPPEVDKSLISQRMLLMLTEKLEQRRLRITTDVLKGESARLSRDQTRLRLAVGDAVFQRLSGESSAEHAHTAGDGHDHGVEAVGGKLALPGTMSATGMLDEGDDSPVIGINKPLLEAYNAMWDAGRALEQADPRAAIPHMRVALAAIERARAASRLYLRGKPPTVILDLARIRLAGKDTGVTNSRSARRALPPGAAAREARLLAAAELATGDPSAAHDSVAVLRLESLADAPEFARALATVVEGLRNGGEITDAFVRARRVLGGVTRGPNAVWSRGGPP